ncbi:MAG: AAA family ATPase [Planctomycetes bacterium]|nr:AAA family ATPase [Planctomycetota bacterium]
MPQPQPRYHDDMADRFSRQITERQTAELADDLGVTAEALRAIGLGHTGQHPCFPERDASGRVVALNQRRGPDAEPRYMVRRGDRRGLIIPDRLAELPDPVLIVEGPSDVAAALTMRLAAVGRPNDRGGTPHLAALLTGRDVLVVGERDEKPDGSWPGRAGAEHVARELGKAWEQPVRWALPPEGAKDTRDYLLQNEGIDPVELGRELLAHFEAAEQTVEPATATHAASCPVCGARGAGCYQRGREFYCVGAMAMRAGAFDRVRETLAGMCVYTRRPAAPDADANQSGLTGDSLPSTGPEVVQRPRAVTIALDAVKASEVEWLWDGRIAKRTLTVVFGTPGVGKSFLMHDLAGRVSAGRAWPVGTTGRTEAAGVVLVTAEDDPAMVLRPRFERANANLSRVTLLEHVTNERGEPGFFSLREHLNLLEEVIRDRADVALLVVDPLAAFLGHGTNADKHSEVYMVLVPLAAIAEQYDLAVVLVHHLNKGRADSALGRTMGSAAFTAIPRNTLFVTKDVQDSRRRLLLHGKASLGPETDGLAFTIEAPGYVAWEPTVIQQTADEHFREDAADRSEQSSLAIAEDFVRRALADGPVLSKDLNGQAAAEGVATSTLHRAKQRLGVRSIQLREDGRVKGWQAVLPADATSGSGSSV